MQLWDLQNLTPFASSAGFERDQTARTFWGVWVKATFDVDATGAVRLATDQEPIHEAAVVNDAGITVVDGDVVLPKANTDIVLTARSAAPEDQRLDQSYPVSLRVGLWQKSLVVQPASIWRDDDGMVLQPGASPNCALSFAESYGGTVTENDVETRVEANPMGRGFVGKTRPASITAPRLMPAGKAWTDPRDAVEPIAFGPIPRHWLPRATLAGTFDEPWMQTRSPLLPKDHDPAFRQSVPADQQYRGTLSGGEEVVFDNVAWGPDGEGRAPTFRLPELNFAVTTKFKGQEEPMEMAIQTLHVNATLRQFSLTYLGVLPIGKAANDVEVARSEIVLGSSGGFSVPADMVEAFHSNTQEAPAWA